MAFLRAFTDASGVEHASTYWRADEITIRGRQRYIESVFRGYASAQAWADGREPILGAAKRYEAAGDQFLAVVMAPASGSTPYEVLAVAVESYALATLDTDDGSGGLVSFFAGATQV